MRWPMDSDTLVPNALRQHEERIATMLEFHRQQLIEAVAHQLSGLAFQRPGFHEQQREQQHSYASESEVPRSPTSVRHLAAESSGVEAPKIGDRLGNRRGSTPSEQWVRQVEKYETLSIVSDNLRTGAEEAMKRLGSSGGSRKKVCCETSSCYEFVHEYAAAAYQSMWFEVVVSLTILVNATMMGVYAEWSLSALDEPTPRWYRIGSACCLAVFSAEIPIRWVTEGCTFLHPQNANFGWNVFDLVLVASTIADEVLQALQGPVLNVSFMRLARFLRLIRVTRVLRVLQHLKELRIMVYGMLNCGKPLLWASLLLGLMAYMFMVFLLQISSDELRGFQDPPIAAEEDIINFLDDQFGSLRHGMYTLLSCITGGVSWQEIADPLFDISPVLFAGFLLYILLGMVCLLNLITAVFLEAAYQQSNSEEAQVLEHIEDKRVWIRDAKKFFQDEFDHHFEASGAETEYSECSNHDVDLECFTQVVQAPRVRAWFEEHGLDIYFADATSLFELIDLDSDHKVDIQEFVAGLYRLKGGASSLNMQLEVQHVLAEIKSLKRSLEKADGKSIVSLSERPMKSPKPFSSERRRSFEETPYVLPITSSCDNGGVD